MFLEHHIIIISVGSCEISEKSKRYFKTKWIIGDNGKVHERLIYDSDWCCSVHAIRKKMRPFSEYVWMCEY